MFVEKKPKGWLINNYVVSNPFVIFHIAAEIIKHGGEQNLADIANTFLSTGDEGFGSYLYNKILNLTIESFYNIFREAYPSTIRDKPKREKELKRWFRKAFYRVWSAVVNWYSVVSTLEKAKKELRHEMIGEYIDLFKMAPLEFVRFTTQKAIPLYIQSKRKSVTSSKQNIIVRTLSMLDMQSFKYIVPITALVTFYAYSEPLYIIFSIIYNFVAKYFKELNYLLDLGKKIITSSIGGLKLTVNVDKLRRIVYQAFVSRLIFTIVGSQYENRVRIPIEFLISLVLRRRRGWTWSELYEENPIPLEIYRIVSCLFSKKPATMVSIASGKHEDDFEPIKFKSTLDLPDDYTHLNSFTISETALALSLAMKFTFLAILQLPEHEIDQGYLKKMLLSYIFTPADVLIAYYKIKGKTQTSGYVRIDDLTREIIKSYSDKKLLSGTQSIFDRYLVLANNESKSSIRSIVEGLIRGEIPLSNIRSLGFSVGFWHALLGSRYMDVHTAIREKGLDIYTYRRPVDGFLFNFNITDSEEVMFL